MKLPAADARFFALVLADSELINNSKQNEIS
jgi:hypothetical protein